MKKQLLTLLLVPAIIIGSLTIPSPHQALAAQSAQIMASVSFRVNPNVSADRIRYLKAGENVTILEKKNNWWYKVQTSDGSIGYVSSESKYIQPSGPSTANPSPSPNTSTSGTGQTVNGVSASEKAQKVIEAGKKYLGTPYEFGSSRSNTNTFDCSDFVRQAFLDGINLKLPSDSRAQGDYVKSKGQIKTNWQDLQPGDLMYFMSYRGSSASAYAGVNKSTQRITHTAIYLGDGKILHTYSKESGGVRINSIAGNAWEYRFLYGGSAF